MKKPRWSVVSAFFFAFVATSHSQDNPSLIDVKKLAPGIVVDMRYATADNFAHQKLYPVADQCLLCEPAAERLARVQKALEKKGLGLKVWDCYRPLSVQKKLWDIVPDDRYVANPKTGSRHNRGASVDLTLVDKNGKELLMPTAFDEFSEKAHRNYSDLPADAIKNRQTLQDAMEAEGFLPLPTEWWHFDSPEWSQYALRDEPLGSESLNKDIKMNDLLSQAIALVPESSTELLVVTSKDWAATTGTMQRYKRKGTKWSKVLEPWPVSIGLNGMAWGKSEFSIDTLKKQGDPEKTEGDNKATAGVFKIGKAYGYLDTPPEKSTWPYQQVDDKWRCVDDPSSSRYNQIFPLDNSVTKDWKSAEVMKRSDHLYKWVINVEQNTPSTCGCGSCIFLHVWRKPNSPTEGCTAMSEANMVSLLRWLKPEAEPILLQLPLK